MIQDWLGVDNDGDLFLYRKKPIRDEEGGFWLSEGNECPLYIGGNPLPDLTPESDPEEVEVIIRRKKK